MQPIVVAICLIAYISLLLVAAYLSSRRAGAEDFFVAGRSLKWYTAASAMITAAMSGITIVSVPGAVARDGLSYMQMTLGFTAGQFLIAFVLIPIFYRLRVISLYQYLETRFGAGAQKTGAWLFFLAKIVIAALRLYILCIVLQPLLYDHLGLPFWLNVALAIGVVLTASLRGGVRSLVWTDILKSFILVGSLILTILFIISALEWNFRETFEQLSQSPYAKIFFFDDPASPYYFWKMFLAGMFSLVAMTGLDQDMMQCNLSCVDSRHAQRGIIATALSQIIVISLFLVLGLLLHAYADNKGIAIPQRSDQLYALLALEGDLPMIVGILFILAITAATFASSCSSLTALTTSCTIDLLGGAEIKDEGRLTALRRKVQITIAMLIGFVALFVGSLSNSSVVNLLFKFVGYAYGPILGIFAFGIFTRIAIKDKYIWLVAALSIALSLGGEFALARLFEYTIGFELLIYNAALTFFGMLLLNKN